MEGGDPLFGNICCMLRQRSCTRGDRGMKGGRRQVTERAAWSQVAKNNWVKTRKREEVINVCVRETKGGGHYHVGLSMT